MQWINSESIKCKYQPRSQFLFHKNGSLHDFYTMTLTMCPPDFQTFWKPCNNSCEWDQIRRLFSEQQIWFQITVTRAENPCYKRNCKRILCQLSFESSSKMRQFSYLPIFLLITNAKSEEICDGNGCTNATSIDV